VADPLYTAEARVTGGRAAGHGRTSDGRLDVELRMPKELGGDGAGTNPEQLFAVGYAACFETVLSLLGQRRQVPAEDAAIEAKVMLVPIAGGQFELGVELAVTLPSVADPEQAADLVRAAHQICPYSKATRGNIEVSLSANGLPVRH
jgi:lipoyl-dependent peroxiredoxin